MWDISHILEGVDIMAQTMVSFRMDEELKQNFDKLCSELGMSMSTAFIVYAKQMIREQRIPFTVSAEPFYSEKNMTYLSKIIENIENGTAVLKEHDII